jgi:hypothetical protein
MSVQARKFLSTNLRQRQQVYFSRVAAVEINTIDLLQSIFSEGFVCVPATPQNSIRKSSVGHWTAPQTIPQKYDQNKSPNTSQTSIGNGSNHTLQKPNTETPNL